MIPLHFRCTGCNQCCVVRHYHIEPNVWTITKDGREQAGYPRLGKRGVELLPSEVRKIKQLAHKLRHRIDGNGDPMQYRILPSVAITPEDQKIPPNNNQIDTYQLMGYTKEGDICPFLSTIEENITYDNGCLSCLIYKRRPLICRSFPVSKLLYSIKNRKMRKCAKVHTACNWVSRQITENGVQWLIPEKEPFPIGWITGLNYGAIIRLQRNKTRRKNTTIWRYATAIGNKEDQHRLMPEGWVNWGWQ